MPLMCNNKLFKTMPSVVVATWEIMKEHGTRVFQNTAIRKFDPTPLLGQIKEETNDTVLGRSKKLAQIIPNI